MTQVREGTRFGVIMAGGAGERFWPLSRANMPKQLLPLTHPTKSMLHEAVERMTPVIPPERLFVITGRHLVHAIRDAEIGLPAENILAEPCKRNTSGALAYVTASLLARHGEVSPERISLAVTTADHRIGDDEAFRQTVTTALRAAECNDALVVCGITPTRPETGFGYVQIADVSKPVSEFTAPPQVFDVSAFHEKPDRQTAQSYVESGHYFWNSGMFFWRVSAFLEELEEAQPQLATAIRDMAAAMQRSDAETVHRLFSGLDDISIDFALMERARRVQMVRGDFPWDDIGSWPSLSRVGATDDHANACFGDPILRDAEGCIVYNSLGASQMALAVVGVRDLIVVATPDAVLVMPKGRSQDVRAIVEEIKARGMPQR